MKRAAAIILLAIVLSVALFSGCAAQRLYGYWMLSYIGDEYGGERSEYPLPLYFEIKSDGTVNMAGDVFGHFKRKGSTFTFKYASDDVTTVESGAYELNSDGELVIYMDDRPMSVILTRPTAQQAS